MNEKRQNALDFATIAHRGQKRKDGKDYITHPIAVAEISLNIADEYGIYEEEILDNLYILSILHDVVEDTIVSLPDIKYIFGYYIAEGIEWLTRTDENYFEFIKNIGHCDDVLVQIVKLADLRHNMNDLKEGTLKDKYRFAEYYIKRSIENW